MSCNGAFIPPPFLKLIFPIYETSVIISLPTSFEILVGRKDDDDENIIIRIFERYCVSVNRDIFSGLTASADKQES